MTKAMLVCLILAAMSTTAAEQTPRSKTIGSNDKQLRESMVVTSPPPTYPPASLKKKVTGVVVAAILVDPKGGMEAVEILQSPDAETGRAVHEALMRWTFRSMGVYGIEGILVFYFHLDGTRGVVLSPAEMREVVNPGVKDVKGAHEPAAKPITDAEFKALSTKAGPVLLDIRDRVTFAEGHDKGAVNIPLNEMLARAPAELLASRPIVIDCRDAPSVCSVGAHFLTSSGFAHVSIRSR